VSSCIISPRFTTNAGLRRDVDPFVIEPHLQASARPAALEGHESGVAVLADALVFGTADAGSG
jgi:hypothetical protein